MGITGGRMWFIVGLFRSAHVTRYQEMDSQEAEYGNNTKILWPHLLLVCN